MPADFPDPYRRLATPLPYTDLPPQRKQDINRQSDHLPFFPPCAYNPIDGGGQLLGQAQLPITRFFLPCLKSHDEISLYNHLGVFSH